MGGALYRSQPSRLKEEKEEKEWDKRSRWGLVWRILVIGPILLYTAIFKRDIPGWLKKILEKAGF